MKKLAIIGLGKMGYSLLKGMMEAEVFKPSEVIACDLRVEEKQENPDFFGISTTRDNKSGAEQAEMILLAVKPKNVDDVIKEIKNVATGKTVISIVAGISIDYLEKRLPSSTRVVRVMPNTPSMVRAGISAISPGDKATDNDLHIVKEIFESVGEAFIIEEDMIDAITGLSGSGPAYMYLIIESLADGGVLNGLSREVAVKLAAQTMLGAAKMVLETGKHPGELKDMVTSPGGTTINALEVLENKGLRGIMIDAVKRATERAKKIG